MLFESRFFIADSYDTEKDVIDWFCETDHYTSLLIVDKYLRIERYKEMREDFDCGVGWLTNTSEGCNRHEIFIHEKFDYMAQKFIVDNNAIVAFFQDN